MSLGITLLEAAGSIVAGSALATAGVAVQTLRVTRRNERLLTGEEAAPGDNGVLGRLDELENDVRKIDERLPDPDRRSPSPRRDRHDRRTD